MTVSNYGDITWETSHVGHVLTIRHKRLSYCIKMHKLKPFFWIFHPDTSKYNPWKLVLMNGEM